MDYPTEMFIECNGESIIHGAITSSFYMNSGSFYTKGGYCNLYQSITVPLHCGALGQQMLSFPLSSL